DVDSVANTGASRYFIEIKIDPASLSGSNGLRYSGVERVLYHNKTTAPLTEIVFRLYPNLPGYDGQLQVERIILNDRPVSGQPEAKDSALRVPLAEPLQPGHSADITVAFSGTAPTQTRQGYNIFSFTDGIAALAGFYPAIATVDDNGWDTAVPPNYGDATFLETSLYRVRLTLPAGFTVAASGSLLSTEQNADGTKTLLLATGPMRDFYLALSADFEVVSGTVDGITVNSYYLPGQAAGGQRALDYALDALEIFDRRFGPYPYAEFDMAATPTTAGGVEYPGIIVASKRFYNETGGFFQHVIGHEVAHQWWYGLVGNNQITEPWLDESLTNYSAAIYWEEAEGAETGAKVVENYFVKPYQRALRDGDDQPVIGPVSAFSQPDYATIVYGKGPLFFHDLRTRLGNDTYFKIMQTYLNRYKYQTTTADDLFAVIEEVSGQSVQPAADTWLRSP
ncbi:MAG: M1 family peptidase, partial [Chloroflexi bacterium]